MKVTREKDIVYLELTRRNLEVLLAKLDDELSERTIAKQNEVETDDSPVTVFVKAVEDAEHYKGREAGQMFMPSSGEWI